jgi:hypothetical protein
VKPADSIVYSVAQCSVALAGVGVFALIGRTVANSVQRGLTVPGEASSGAFRGGSGGPLPADVSDFILRRQFANRRPDSVFSGCGSLRSWLFWTRLFQFQWIYWIAPVLGALAAVPSVRLLFPEKNKEGRAKLFHAERYRCIFPTRSYPRVPAKSVLLKEGE